MSRCAYLLALLCLLSGAPSWPDEAARADEAVSPEADDPGASLYRSLCGECHGLDGRGAGARAVLIEPEPPDLTRLADRHEELLRLDVLTRVIDGRRTLRAHGDDRMPVWGNQLAAGAPDSGMREQVRIRLVQSLAEYLLSIQVAPAADDASATSP